MTTRTPPHSQAGARITLACGHATHEEIPHLAVMLHHISVGHGDWRAMTSICPTCRAPRTWRTLHLREWLSSCTRCRWYRWADSLMIANQLMSMHHRKFPHHRGIVKLATLPGLDYYVHMTTEPNGDSDE